MINNTLNQYDKYLQLFREYDVNMRGYLQAISSFEQQFGFQKYARRSNSAWGEKALDKGTWLLLYRQATHGTIPSLNEYLESLRGGAKSTAYVDSLMVLREPELPREFSFDENPAKRQKPAFALTRVQRSDPTSQGIGIHTKVSTAVDWIPYGTRYPYHLRPLGALTNSEMIESTSEPDLLEHLRGLLFKAWI